MKRQDPSAVQPALRYVPIALYTFGVCHYGHKDPYRTDEVAADSLQDAWQKARRAIQIGVTEHLCHVGTKPNPAYMAYTAERARLYDKVVASPHGRISE